MDSGGRREVGMSVVDHHVRAVRLEFSFAKLGFAHFVGLIIAEMAGVDLCAVVAWVVDYFGDVDDVFEFPGDCVTIGVFVARFASCPMQARLTGCLLLGLGSEEGYGFLIQGIVVAVGR